jgi:hypothetical protein
MHQRKIYEWIERFKERRTSVTDESRPCRPSTWGTDQHIQRVDALIREDGWLTLAHAAQVRLAWWRPASSADVASWATKIFFYEGIKKLVEWFQKCIIVHGDYIKNNMCICSPSVELKLLSQNCLYLLIHPRTCCTQLQQTHFNM